nr:putative receptor-like protein kinase At3g47110 [Ziziphus jujuba var. spinosa]
MKSASSAPTYANESDLLALLDFMNRIVQDPLEIMNSWNGSIHFCNWVGIACNRSSKRVVVLNLKSLDLFGSIPPSIGNLTYHTEIHLQNNSFHGEIPQEMGHLLQLMQGAKEFSCIWQQAYWFNSSPVQFIVKTNALEFGRNNFTGTMPPWIRNFTSLAALSFGENNFQGSIPEDLGHLTGLRRFILTQNNLSGIVPPSIYNISSMFYLTFTANQLHGNLPQDIGLTLPNLKVFSGGVNKLTGPIPISLSNCSALEVLDFAQNDLIGTVPDTLGRLRNVYRINFENNGLGHGKANDLNFFRSLPNCSVLEIPNGIKNLVNLILLGLGNNQLGGSVPEAIGKLHKLKVVSMDGNKFSESIPLSLGNLT